MVEVVLAMLRVKSNESLETIEVATVGHVENEVTQKVNGADQAPIVQRVHHDQSDRATTKVAEIVVQGVLPVDTMVATVVQVHHVDAKLSN